MSTAKPGQIWPIELQSTHTPAHAERWVRLADQLPQGDSQTVLRKITEWLAEIVQTPDIPLQQQLDAIDRLDRIAKSHQLNLIPAYLDTPRMRKLSESRLWTASFGFWQALGDAYLHCLERFQAAEEGAKDFRHNLPMVTCRILRALTVQLKWTLLRYARVEDRIWRDLGRTFLLASNWGFSTRRSTIYPGSHGETTAQEELLKALMLTISSPDALTPVQLHVAERIVAHFGNRFALHTTSGPGCTFVFDLSMHTAPARSRKGASPTPLLRFFGQGTATEFLNLMIEHLQQHGSLPPDTTQLGSTVDPAIVESVLQHLARCWSDTAVARRGRRQEIVTRLTVVPGFGATAGWLKEMLDKDTVEIDNPHESESWIVLDSSDDGCGALIPALLADWLAIGTLVGLRRETATECRMGILRRISPDIYDQHHVGIQHLGEQAVPVELFPATAKSAENPAHAGEPAILISRRPDSRGIIELLMKPGSFNYAESLQMRYIDRLYKIDKVGLVEKGNDYKRVAYRLILAV